MKPAAKTELLVHHYSVSAPVSRRFARWSEPTPALRQAAHRLHGLGGCACVLRCTMHRPHCGTCLGLLHRVGTGHRFFGTRELPCPAVAGPSPPFLLIQDDPRPGDAERGAAHGRAAAAEPGGGAGRALQEHLRPRHHRAAPPAAPADVGHASGQAHLPGAPGAQAHGSGCALNPDPNP